MTKLLFLLLLFTSTTAYSYDNASIVDGIYRIEGGNKAQYAYGIRSVKYKDKAEARRICFNTVRNNRVRYAKAVERGFKGDYIKFLASRFCPIGCDNDRGTNKFWENNLRRVLK